MTATEIISVRLTAEQAEFLRWRARAAGTTVSAQVRRAVEALPGAVLVAYGHTQTIICDYGGATP